MDLREDAKRIFLHTLKAVSIEVRMKALLQVKDDKLWLNAEAVCLSDYDEILLIGFGKASLEMGKAIEALLEGRVKRGVLVTNQRGRYEGTSEVIVAGHPTPTQNSLLAAERILDLIKHSTERTLIIFLISGGGSSLVELPVQGLTLEDLRQTNRALVNSGASISEINLVRKCLSQLKGGKLARIANGIKSIAIYLSDVNTDDLAALASGPLISEWGTTDDALKIIERYNLSEKLSPAVLEVIKENPPVTIRESPAQANGEVASMLLLDNRDAVATAALIAQQRSYQTEIIPGLIEGDYREIADILISHLVTLQGRFPTAPVCIISGGEAACPVTGGGIGGRNQEFVLYSAIKLSENSSDLEMAVLSCGTDGIDGISPATGAVADTHTVITARSLGVEAETYLRQNDSYSFWKQIGGLLLSGPSGNNVRDLRVLLAKPKSI